MKTIQKVNDSNVTQMEPHELGPVVRKKLGKLSMKYNIPDKVRRDICRFAKQRGTKKVILFGSRARGTHTERSDIDIAVSGGDATGLYLDLEECSHSLLMFDVIDLDKGVSDELKQEIERDGILIYEEA